MLLFIVPVLYFSYFSDQKGILFSTKDYLELIDYTGRAIRQDKRGSIPNHLPAIQQRLNLEEKQWLERVTRFERLYGRSSGIPRLRLKKSA